MAHALIRFAVVAVFGVIVVAAIRRHLVLRNGDWHFADGLRERRFVDGRWEYRNIGGGSTVAHRQMENRNGR